MHLFVMSDKIRILPVVKSLVVSTSPRLEILWLSGKRGQIASMQIPQHGYAAVSAPATSNRRLNLGPRAQAEWGGMSTGFVPAGWRLDSELTSDYESTSLLMDEAVFTEAQNENLTYRPDHFHPLTGAPSPVGNALIMALRNFIETTEIDDWPMLTEHVATSLASHLMKQFSGGKLRGKDPFPPALPRERMRRVVDFVEANLHRDIHLNELASVAALSSFHFARSFKQMTGVTPVRYIWRRRVERAKVLLRNREVPLAVIALDCGFSSQSHFTTVFKRETGYTPAQYRAKL